MTEVRKQLFVGGAWADAADGATLPVDDPATGEVIAHVADAGPKDARLAEEAAVRAQPDCEGEAVGRQSSGCHRGPSPEDTRRPNTAPEKWP
ncbi:hypothetical protein ACWEP7_38650, partial [Streptomyces sp. NPDC004135]